MNTVLTSGSLSVHQTNGVIMKAKRTIVHCYHCKYGGICNKGSIRPQANYFGL